MDIGLTRHRHLHEEEIAERPGVDSHVAAISEPIERHRPEWGMVHASMQRAAVQG